MSKAQNAICSHCGQRAPVVLRGIEARCTVCGGLRIPFTAKALNLAGKPSRAGGVAARFVGWTAVVMGLSMATGLGLLLQTVFGGYVGLAIGIPIAMLSLFFGLALVLGGRKLGRSGDQAERSARLQAIRALAKHQGGSVTAAGVARKLELSEAEADALLTDLAKEPSENVSLELDDDGGLHYLFGVDALAWRIDPGARIATDGAADAEAEREMAAIEEAREARQRRAPGRRTR